MKKAVHRRLEKCAASGVPFKRGGAHVDAAWVREAVVTGKIPDTDTDVHAKGIRISGQKGAPVVIDGPLDFESANLKVPLMLDYVGIGDPVVLEQATGTLISLRNCHVSSVFADQLRLDHSLKLEESTFVGGVTLLDATIDGNLTCHGSSFTYTDGPSFIADRMQVDGSVSLSGGFRAEGQVLLVSATIGKQLNCRKGSFQGPGDRGFALQEANIGGFFFWEDTSLGGNTGMDLRACSVGFLDDSIESWPGSGQLLLDGFTYQGFAGETTSWDANERIDWIERQPQFKSQPYEQLAKVYRDAGRPVDARDVGIAREGPQPDSRIVASILAFSLGSIDGLWVQASPSAVDLRRRARCCELVLLVGG